MTKVTDTIAAIATPPGRGGVGIIRLSGPKSAEIAEVMLGKIPEPRYATFADFLSRSGEVLDEGIALYFPGPNSFTGEDVLELQGHGGPVVMDMLLNEVSALGARLARPGEFSERAFLNDKLDLAQAEAISDLIDAETTAAARLANRTLRGEFSERIHNLVEVITHLRMYVEAAIDFPEEEIDFLSDGKVENDLNDILRLVEDLNASASTGSLLREGMTLVIAGKPNAGKSSLMNALSGEDMAIVTDVPGTTRDILRHRVEIDGMPIHLIDTAGLRITENPVEQEGIRRAKNELANADHVIWMYNELEDPSGTARHEAELPQGISLTLVQNKIDLVEHAPEVTELDGDVRVALSAKHHQGMDLLRERLKQVMGYQGSNEGDFIARRRHLDAIRRAHQHLLDGQQAMLNGVSGELLAEDLRYAQMALGEITGEFTADDLLGEIFSSFCIGK